MDDISPRVDVQLVGFAVVMNNENIFIQEVVKWRTKTHDCFFTSRPLKTGTIR